MKDKRKSVVKVPISLKLVSIFSILVICILSGITVMISTLVRSEERIKAEENNHIINARTAETIQETIVNVQSNADGFLNALLVINDSPDFETQSKLLFEDFCERNPDCSFLYATSFELKVNNAFSKSYSQTQEKFFYWLDNNIQYVKKIIQGEVEVVNLCSVFNTPILGILFSHYNSITNKNDFIVVGVECATLADITSSSSYNETFVINKDGIILIHADEEMMIGAENLSYLDAISEIKQSKLQNSQILRPDQNGKNWFYSYNRIVGNMFVITCVSEDDVYESLNRTTYRIILLIVAVLLLSILFIRLFSRTLTKPIDGLVEATKKIAAGDYDIQLDSHSKDEIAYLSDNFMEMTNGLAERNRLMNTFTKFTNKFIAEKAARDELAPGGERKNATIFFSDIRSFTALSEKLTPDEVVEFLNEYFARMCECVDKTSGIVDKFVGDAVMAVWGAPETSGSPQSDAWNAIKGALMMRIALYHFNRKREKEGKTPIKIGCGINSGPIVAGQIGCEGHMNYTVIGDTVNLASRTEALNKPFATDILITENTYKLVKDKIIAEEMPGVHVKGKTDAIRMFAVVNAKGVKGPKDIHELRKFLGWDEPNLDKVSTDEEEKKYKIDG